MFRGKTEFSTMDTLPEKTCIYVVGDIHGRADLLNELHDLVSHDAEKYPDFRRIIIYLGDYIDRGLQSREVVETLLHFPLIGFESIYLKGNHESMLLNFLNRSEDQRPWLLNGGIETLISYHVEMDPSAEADFELIRMALLNNMPKEHLAFFQNLKLFHVEGNYFFCHGGIDPDLPLEMQTEENLMWIRESFLTSTKDHGKIIVHGHTITEKPIVLPNRIGIDTGAVFSNVLTCLVLSHKDLYFLHTKVLEQKNISQFLT